MVRSVAKFLVLLAIAGVLLHVYREPTYTTAMQLYRFAAPCSVPIPYRIGNIDPRFGVGTSSVLVTVDSAVASWEKASGLDLFVYSTSTSAMSIDFIYDSRQEITNTLKELGLSIDEDMGSYEAAKERYTTVYASYESLNAQFETQYAAYKKDAAAHEAQVNMWNERGGAPSAQYGRLQKEQAELKQREAALEQLQQRVNGAIKNVNALAVFMNHLAEVLNTQSSTYNSIGAQQKQEFQEAVYERSFGSEVIHVYEFDGMLRLKRVLAHELGHSLGLNHVENEASIMYRLNQGRNEVPTAEDMAELSRACRL